MKPSRLYLIDAHAYLHRAYHALPPLTNSRGEPVGALFGFARMLLQLLKNEKPEAIAVCFDSPGATFRHELFEAYKATRKETDGDLVSQLALARGMAEAMGLACVELKGFEADDLMATLARRALDEGFEAVLVTGDKDALQLVGPRVKVLNVAKGAWFDADAVAEKLGVPPSGVVDYLTIIGDASDNIPGIKGIGPVGAVKLLKAFGSLAGALAAARAGSAGLPPKTAAALLAAEEGIKRAAELLRLKDDVSLDLGPAACARRQPEPAQLTEAFERLEFRTLLKEMLPDYQPASAAVGAAAPPSPERMGSPSAEGAAAAPTDALRDVPWAELKDELARAKTILVACLRNEAKDLADPSSALLALGLEDGRGAVLAEHEARAERRFLNDLFASSTLKACYDAKTTSRALAMLGLELKGPVFDVMLARYSLDPAAPRPGVDAEDLRGAVLVWAGRARGHEALREAMRSAKVLALYDQMELPLAEVLAGMEDCGVALDEPLLRRLSVEFKADLAALQKDIEALAGCPVNVHSPKQLGALLYDTLGLPVPHKTAKGGRSTDEEALRSLASAHAIPAKVLEFRELSKLDSTYVQVLLARLDPRTKRVHTTFDQAGTATGRLSSLDPNLQNIPIRAEAGQRIRRAFVAEAGSVLVSADYSQIDLRVLAHVSEDRVLTEAFLGDEDVHLRTASEVFSTPPDAVTKEMRRSAKAINFGIVYGQSAHGLAIQLGIPRPEAADYIKRYFERYEGVASWIKRNLEAARAEGVVRTWAGRLRKLPELAAKNAALRAFGERAASNTPIQGGSADVIKVAMLRLHEGLRQEAFHAKMLLQIHDELLFEVPVREVEDFAPWVRAQMEGAVSWKIPMKVDVKVGSNWQDMHALERQSAQASR